MVSPVSPGKKIDKVVEKVKEVDREFRNEDYFRSRFLILRDMVTDWVEALEFNGFYIEVEGQIDASFDILGSCCGDYKRFCGDKGDLMDVIEAYIWHSALLSFRAPDAEVSKDSIQKSRDWWLKKLIKTDKYLIEIFLPSLSKSALVFLGN